MDSELRSRDKGGYDRTRFPAKGGGNKKRERERDKMHSRQKVFYLIRTVYKCYSLFLQYNEPPSFQPTKILSKPASERVRLNLSLVKT